MTMPSPATAAAIAPSLALTINRPLTWKEVASSSLRKDQCPPHENREPWDDLANGKVRSQTDPQYAAQLSRSARRVFRLVEFRENRLYASQEVRAGVG